MPEFAEVADGLQMPLADAMRTQRAVRRLRPDPVDDETVLERARARHEGARPAATSRAGSSSWCATPT